MGMEAICMIYVISLTDINCATDRTFFAAYSSRDGGFSGNYTSTQFINSFLSNTSLLLPYTTSDYLTRMCYVYALGAKSLGR